MELGGVALKKSFPSLHCVPCVCFHSYVQYWISKKILFFFLFVFSGGWPGISSHSGNKKLNLGLNTMHPQSPNNRPGWGNRGGERRRRRPTQEMSSRKFVTDKSWVGGWVESSQSLGYCGGALTRFFFQHAEHTLQINSLSWQLRVGAVTQP